MDKSVEIKWLTEPEAHDYPAAQAYLSLLYDDQTTRSHIERLRHAPVSRHQAKDIFRASGLSLLGVSNRHVTTDQSKIRSGQALSPLLLLRDAPHGRLIIADGYHRLCAVYSFDEDAVIPCKVC